MSSLLPYLGDLHRLLEPHWAGTILVLVSVLCGLIIGQERESKHKPAGLRTVTLICVGSTIFTLSSILMAAGGGDPGRIAAQVVTGMGFLGAGAIIRERGTIVGLTTGATIWVTAAIGVLIGTGYAVGGVALTLVVVGTLRGAQILEMWTTGSCRYTSFVLKYKVSGGRSYLRALRILDEFRIPDSSWSITQEGEFEVIRIRCCTVHRLHRAVLFHLVDLPELVEISPSLLRDTGSSTATTEGERSPGSGDE